MRQFSAQSQCIISVNMMKSGFERTKVLIHHLFSYVTTHCCDIHLDGFKASQNRSTDWASKLGRKPDRRLCKAPRLDPPEKAYINLRRLPPGFILVLAEPMMEPRATIIWLLLVRFWRTVLARHAIGCRYGIRCMRWNSACAEGRRFEARHWAALAT